MTTWTCWRDPSHDHIETTEFGWPQCQVCQAAPQYHERADYVPENFALEVYVPIKPPLNMLVPRSAIVGLPAGRSMVDVYYEGWVHGPAQYADRDARGLWEAGLEHAAGRMVCTYPTGARAFLPTDALRRIGHFYPKTKQLIVEDREALEAWLT